MKGSVLAIAFVLVWFARAQPQDVVGNWQGTLKAGAIALRIVLHVSKADDGSLKATMDSLDQGAMGMRRDVDVPRRLDADVRNRPDRRLVHRQARAGRLDDRGHVDPGRPGPAPHAHPGETGRDHPSCGARRTP